MAGTTVPSTKMAYQSMKISTVQSRRLWSTSPVRCSYSICRTAGRSTYCPAPDVAIS